MIPGKPPRPDPFTYANERIRVLGEREDTEADKGSNKVDNFLRLHLTLPREALPLLYVSVGGALLFRPAFLA